MYYEDDYDNPKIGDLQFVKTCGACPEQYDVFLEDDQVAYVRLRWGGLRVDMPDCGGERVYSHAFDDGLKGCFDSYEERTKYLTEIANVIGERRALALEQTPLGVD